MYVPPYRVPPSHLGRIALQQEKSMRHNKGITVHQKSLCDDVFESQTPSRAQRFHKTINNELNFNSK